MSQERAGATTDERQALARVAVALDTADWPTFVGWCELFGPRVGVLKVGLQAFTTWGPAAAAEARRYGSKLFLDLKLHDIPKTVGGAVGAVRDLGADYVTLHAAGGSAMLGAAAEAAGDQLRLLAVTLLTHLDGAALAELDLPGDGATRALRWARLAHEAGCRGAVCSPLEVAALRSGLPKPFDLVTPGVRPAGVSRDDQRRTATPCEALAAGADLLVIGRPLTAALDPEAALDRLVAELTGAPTLAAR
jgi:orotidine-5'-phosphate decarboxylase